MLQPTSLPSLFVCPYAVWERASPARGQQSSDARVTGSVCVCVCGVALAQLTALRWPAGLMSASIATLARVSEALTPNMDDAVEHARVRS